MDPSVRGVPIGRRSPRGRGPYCRPIHSLARGRARLTLDLPRERWPQIASTNPLERLDREIKRRSDVVGIVPNDAAVTRLVGALMLEASDEWAVTRRTMSLEALARVVQTDPVSLPITAARSARASPKAGAPKPPHRALPCATA